MPILFFSEGIRFKLPHPRKTARWIEKSGQAEKLKIGTLNYIFCSDSYLHKVNKQYLNHDTLTDIITFPNDDPEGISADIFVSIPRVRENARHFKVSFDQELHRVLIHGLLHLAGLKDKTEREKARMREKEEAYLSLRT
ncbi:MAG: rRNA maturation RNase YbeY [Cyclobacteriaceae bacterium]